MKGFVLTCHRSVCSGILRFDISIKKLLWHSKLYISVKIPLNISVSKMNALAIFCACVMTCSLIGATPVYPAVALKHFSATDACLFLCNICFDEMVWGNTCYIPWIWCCFIINTFVLELYILIHCNNAKMIRFRILLNCFTNTQTRWFESLASYLLAFIYSKLVLN